MERSSDRWDPTATTQSIPIVAPPPPYRAAGAGVRPADTVVPGPTIQVGSLPFHLLGRLAASTLDLGGVAFVLATFGYRAAALGYLRIVGRDSTGYATLALLSLAGAVLVGLASEAIFGTTLGKLLFGLHVRRRDGRRVGVGRTIVRYAFRPLDLLGIGPLLAALTPRRQRLGDLLADTVVSRSPLGFFAPLLALSLLGGVGYAQASYGGGWASATAVASETTDFAPGLVARGIVLLRSASRTPATSSADRSTP